MKQKKLRTMSIIAVLEALIILCLAFVFVSYTAAPPRKTFHQAMPVLT